MILRRDDRRGIETITLPFALEASAVSAVAFFSFLIERPENAPGHRDAAQENHSAQDNHDLNRH